MGKAVNVTRITLSVHKTLHRRMKEYTGKVNWSAIASQAFSLFLDRRLACPQYR